MTGGRNREGAPAVTTIARLTLAEPCKPTTCTFAVAAALASRGISSTQIGSTLAGFALSLADASVNPFPQQVGVAAVAGVLLDHVDKHFA